MKYPFCSATDTQVIDSRVNEAGDSIRRRRKCLRCEKRFTTYENADLGFLQLLNKMAKEKILIKKKLRQSFSRALHKRPVPAEFVEQAISNIMQKVLALGEKEIVSRSLGESVMSELKKLDKVAYIRFASVYRSFSDVEDFNNVIKDLD